MLIFNSKAVVERRGFRPKIFDEQFVKRPADADLKAIIRGILDF
ncbi:hypothetical protein ACQY1Y_23715 [Microcystis ichthyoblabe FBCC-A1114]